MSHPAARVGDQCSCPLVGPGGVKHPGGVITTGHPMTFFSGPPVARVGDTILCPGPPPHPDSIVTGSITTFNGGRPVAFLGSMTACGGQVVSGAPTILIGDGKATVPARLAEMRTPPGHGPQRHGSQLTQQQLADRALHKIDPETGTTDDRYAINQTTGMPKKHACGKHATKINSDDDYVLAANGIQASPEYDQAEQAANKAGRDSMQVSIPAERVFGATSADRLSGMSATPGAVTATPTAFTPASTIKGVYVRDTPSSPWTLLTMYPNPT